MNSTFERIKRVVVDHLAVDEAKVIETANFRDDLGADSLDAIELTMGIEEEFGIEIGDATMGRMHTVKDAVEVVDALLVSR